MSVSSILGSSVSSIVSPPALQKVSSQLVADGSPQTIHTFTGSDYGVWIIGARDTTASGSFSQNIICVSDVGVATITNPIGMGDNGTLSVGVSGNSLVIIGTNTNTIVWTLVKLV